MAPAATATSGEAMADSALPRSPAELKHSVSKPLSSEPLVKSDRNKSTQKLLIAVTCFVFISAKTLKLISISTHKEIKKPLI